MPQRIQRKRTKGFRIPEGAIYVGRPTKWGNPFRWTDYQAVVADMEGELSFRTVEHRRRYAVVDFQAAVAYGGGLPGYPSREEIRRELAGKDLACWCPLPADGEPDNCHAAVLLSLANEETPDA